MKVFKGETVAGGVALGPVFLRGYGDDEDYPHRIPADEVEDALDGLRRAIETSRRQIEDLKSKHEGELGENELRIFDVHLAYLADPMFVEEIEKLVVGERYSVRTAIRNVIANYDRIFQLVENEYLRQRAGDFRDVGTRVLRNLDVGGVASRERPTPPGRYVLAARKLTVSDLFNLDNERVEGIVTEEGGISSHAGILARSMAIPTLTGISDLPVKLRDEDFVIVDATAGELHIDPDERLRAEYEEAAKRLREARVAAPDPELRHATRDGTPIELLASCGSSAEVNLALTFGMQGVGVYRTELMFLVDSGRPSEDVLARHYRDVAERPAGMPFAFRLLDVTAHSRVAELDFGPERNAALGSRGVRALLRERHVLRRQLRAILRAAAGDEDTAVLVPFVTGVADLQLVQQAIIEERLDLKKRGVAVASTLKVAPIVEVPAAAFVLRALLNDADYVVVAIDDLQSLMLAADRDNPSVRSYYESVHPAVLEVLARIARDAEAMGKRIVLFGEGAADPLRLPFYLGIGIRSFSIAPASVQNLLAQLTRYTIDECKRVADKVLNAPRALDAQRTLLRLVERRR